MAVPLALLVSSEVLAPGLLRTSVRGVLSLAVFGAMVLWVRLNRAALEAQEWCDCAGAKTTVRVIPSRRRLEPSVVPGRWIAEDEEVGITAGSRWG
jgi:hypothetical protein